MDDKGICKCFNYNKLSGYITSLKDRKRYCILAKQLANEGILKEVSGSINNYDFEKKYVCNFCGKTFESINDLIESKSRMVSEHIKKIDKLCRANNVEETYRGTDTYNSSKTGEWVYYECYFDEQKIRERLNLPTTIKYIEYRERFSADESGFLDELTNDAILGYHPYTGKMANKKLIE